jgi:large subunit ribosomal protein L4
MESVVYSLDGKKSGNITLPEQVFGVTWNADLVKQVVDSLLSSQRKNVAHTKNRGEVAGGGKKPWKQKGTGRARHGSIRSPIWVGGGVAHGPRNEKNYDRIVSKKMKTKALYTLLSKKWKEGEVLFVDTLTVKDGRTRQAVSALKSLSAIKGYETIATKRRNAVLLALSSKDRMTERAFGNLGQVTTLESRNLNPLALLQYKYLVFENPDVSLKSLPKMAKSRVAKA